MKFRNRQLKITILLLSLTLIVLLPSENRQYTGHQSNYGYQKVIAYMSNHGIIENKQKWHQLVHQTGNGRSIQNVKELNNILHQGNKHSSAAKSAKSYDVVNYPTTSKYGNLRIINVPTFSSENKVAVKKYRTLLHRQIKLLKNKDRIILNFANNRGGDPQAMIAGLATLIPDGTLFTEIAQNGHKYNFIKNKHRIYDSKSHETTELPVSKQLSSPKIYVITNEKTASAAEFAIIALKNNKNTKIIGYPTAGYTSINTLLKINHKAEVANITTGTVVSKTMIGGKRHFNNEPITPDKTTLYEPASTTTHNSTKKPVSLDPDFIKELNNLINTEH